MNEVCEKMKENTSHCLVKHNAIKMYEGVDTELHKYLI
jgi:hypothetical protein